jgi:Uma2 family endonuclease
MTFDEFWAGDYAGGHQYELIDGKLSVTPWPKVSEAVVESWLTWELGLYSRARPAVINFLTSKARIIVPGDGPATCFGPVVAAYRDFPHWKPLGDLRWQDVSPVLVAQVLATADPDAELRRKLELYLRVPSVREYWLVNIHPNPEHPTLRAYQRSGTGWRYHYFTYGGTYTTELLPGFELPIDPRRFTRAFAVPPSGARRPPRPRDRRRPPKGGTPTPRGLEYRL